MGSDAAHSGDNAEDETDDVNPRGAPTFLSYDPRDFELAQGFVRAHRRELGIIRSVGVTGGDAIVGSRDERRIIDEIRRKYIANADLTIVLVGDRTWTRRFVDWEIAASASQGCGVLAVPLGDSHRAIPARLQLLAEEGRGVIAERPPVDTTEIAELMHQAMTIRALPGVSSRAMKTPLMQRDARSL